MTRIPASRTAHASSTTSSTLSHAATLRDLATSSLPVFATETRCACRRSQEIASTPIGPSTGKYLSFIINQHGEHLDLWIVMGTLVIAFTIRYLQKPPVQEVQSRLQAPQVSPAMYRQDAKGAQTARLFCLLSRAGRHTRNIRLSIPTSWRRSVPPRQPRKRPDPSFEL